jgi:uncharacterized damage-inducible protein DinB
MSLLPLPTALPDGHVDEARRIIGAAVAILRQGEELLAALPAETYSRVVSVAFDASIGGHYRHCLDHFASLLAGVDQDMVDYDHRERDPRIEQEPAFAREATEKIRERLGRLDAAMLAEPVMARCEVSYGVGSSPITASTLGRELVYVIAHGIHHYALITVMARLQGADVPEDFGVAPSTVRHRRSVDAH